jgi:hypothetical protein
MCLLLLLSSQLLPLQQLPVCKLLLRLLLKLGLGLLWDLQVQDRPLLCSWPRGETNYGRLPRQDKRFAGLHQGHLLGGLQSMKRDTTCKHLKRPRLAEDSRQ